MKTIFVLLLFYLACATTNLFAQSAQQADSATLQEATRLHIQVIELYKQNKFDEALPLAKKVVAIREKELQDDDRVLTVSLVNLAYLQRAKRNYGEAEKYFRKGLKVEEKRLGKDHPDLYELLTSIAWVCHAQSKATEAEELFKQAILPIEKRFGPEHKNVADAMLNLALFYQKLGIPEKSLPLYERMLKIREKAFGEISNEVKETVEQCACAFDQSKKTPKGPEAMKMWERARMIERKLKPDYEHATGQVLQGKATRKVQPEYPGVAKESRLSGTVLVKVIIDEMGKVIEAKRLCGPDLLSPVSEVAASKWLFIPTQVDGKPVKVQGILTFNFTLQ